MQSKLISETGSSRLIIIFAGWSIGPEVFEGYSRPGYDIMVVWDYTDPHIDWTCTEPYGEICIFAWSMGVYAATVSTAEINCKISKRIAVNGTPTPVDDLAGIPEAVFKGTLDNLDERNYTKFCRRMCGSREAYAGFAERLRPRPIESLRDELRALGDAATGNRNTPRVRWDLAIIGLDDAIFPADNQRRAWEGVASAEIAAPHYFDFRRILDRYFIDKQLVGTRFASGRATYDENAPVQKQCVDALVESILGNGLGDALAQTEGPILEIGCGTGLLSRELMRMAPHASIEMWDLVDKAPVAPSGRISFKACDAEQAICAEPRAKYAFIASSSTVQWFNSPGRFLGECARVLKPGGYLLLTTFGPGNMEQVDALTGHSLPLHSADEWARLAAPGLEPVDMTEMELDLTFDTPMDVLRHLKLTGVNALGRASANPAEARRLLRHYPTLPDGRCRLTYKPLIMIFRHKAQ